MIYRLYHLHLYSDLVFPELASVSSADVDVQFGLAPQWPYPNDDEFEFVYESDSYFKDQPLCQVLRGESAYLMRYADTGDFVIPRNGKEIVCYPIPDTTEDDIRACVLGPVFALYFHLQETQVLHASAIVIDGQAVAFVDWCGGGKSTLAAAFVQQGYSLLTDDVLVLREMDGVHWSTPGYPVLRLWPEVVARLFGSPDKFARLLPRLEKRCVPVGDAFYAAPCPLGAICLLDEHLVHDEGKIQPTAVNPREAVIELVRNTYGARWLESDMWANQFDHYCHLASNVPMRRVSFQRELSRLPAVRAAILDDLATLQIR